MQLPALLSLTRLGTQPASLHVLNQERAGAEALA